MTMVLVVRGGSCVVCLSFWAMRTAAPAGAAA